MDFVQNTSSRLDTLVSSNKKELILEWMDQDELETILKTGTMRFQMVTLDQTSVQGIEN